MTKQMVMIIARTKATDEEGLFGQMYGVTAAHPQSAASMIQWHLESAGQFEFVRVYAVRSVDWADRDKDLKNVRSASEAEGVWYVSGRAWFDQGEENTLDDLM